MFIRRDAFFSNFIPISLFSIVGTLISGVEREKRENGDRNVVGDEELVPFFFDVLYSICVWFDCLGLLLNCFL